MPVIGLSRPQEQALAPALKVGEIAPKGFECQGKYTLVAFLRHTGCPFAEALVKHMSRLSQQYPALNCVVVCHGNTDVSLAWLSQFSLSDTLRVVFDPERERYGEWGVGYSGVSHLVHLGVLISLIRLLFRGTRNRDASGTRWQQHASFFLDGSNKILWRHTPRHAGELPDFDALLSSWNWDTGVNEA